MKTNLTKSMSSIVKVPENVYRESVSRRKFLSLAAMTASGVILSPSASIFGNNPV
jgi:hypothetical protein